MFENIESFLSNNNELAWIAIFMFAFMESFILSGIIVSSAILFSVCIFVFISSYIAIFLIKSIMGLRISEEAEKLGTDKAEVGVVAYSIRD